MRILIVEDEPLVALDLKHCIEEGLGAATQILVAEGLAAATTALAQAMDFVLLDVTVIGGTTFDLARQLRLRGTPFAFASAHNRTDIPEDLRTEVFLPKPCCAKAVLVAIRGALHSGKAATGL